MQQRLQRQRTKLRKLLDAGALQHADMPAEWLAVLQRQTMGRPRLTDDELRHVEHASARRKRLAAAARTLAAQAPQGVSSISILTAAADAIEAEEGAEQLEQPHRLLRELTEKNQDGRIGLLAAAMHASVDDASAPLMCMVCLDEKDESNEAVRRMRCCAQYMHESCLRNWLQEGARKPNGGRMPTGYEDGVQGVDHVRHGRRVWTERVDTHRCPLCGTRRFWTIL